MTPAIYHMRKRPAWLLVHTAVDGTCDIEAVYADGERATEMCQYLNHQADDQFLQDGEWSLKETELYD